MIYEDLARQQINADRYDEIGVRFQFFCRPIVLPRCVLHRVLRRIRPHRDGLPIRTVAIAVLKAAGRCGVIAELRNHTVQRIGHVHAAVGGVFLSVAGNRDSGDGLVQAQAGEKSVAQLPISDLAERLLAFIQILHRLGGVAALGNAALDSAAKGVVGEAGV